MKYCHVSWWSTQRHIILLKLIKLIILTSCVNEGLMKDEMDDSDPEYTIKSFSEESPSAWSD